MSRKQVALLRELGLKVLHFFTVFVLGYDRHGPPGSFHWRLCRAMEVVQRPTFFLCYRGALKSTTAKARMLWRAAQDPVNFDAMLLVDDGNLGLQHLAEIGEQVEQNEVLHRLYPELKPKPKSWSDDSKSLSVRGLRKTGPTWELRTLRQSVTGRHRAMILIDDPVNDSNYQSRGRQQELKDGLDTMWPTLNTDELIWTGTRYVDYDYWGYLIAKLYPQDLELFVQPVRGRAWVEGDGSLGLEDDGVYADPRAWNDETFEESKRRATGPGFWAAQYLLDTRVKDSLSFQPGWFKHVQRSQLPELSIYIALDPASGTGTTRNALAVVGIDGHKPYPNLYVLAGRAGYPSEAAYVEGTFAARDEFNPVRMGQERYGQGGHGIWQQLEQRGRELGRPLPIEPLTGGGDKVQRARTTLYPQYEWGRVYHLAELKGGELENELDAFPNGEYKDLVDALTWTFHLALKYGYRGRSVDRLPEVVSNGSFGTKPGYTLEQLARPRVRDEDFEGVRGVL